MSKHILIAVTNTNSWGSHDKPTGLWFGELTHFVQEVEAAGHTWQLCSPKGGPVPVDPRSLGWMFMQGSDRALHRNPGFMKLLESTQAAKELEPDGFNAIYFAGGHGSMWDFPDNPELRRLAEGIYAQGGYVTAVCHGVAGLLNLEQSDGRKLIAGSNVTGYSDFEEYVAGDQPLIPYSLQQALSDAGADFQKAWLPFGPKICVDERIITGQNPRSAAGVGKALAGRWSVGLARG